MNIKTMIAIFIIAIIGVILAGSLATTIFDVVNPMGADNETVTITRTADGNVSETTTKTLAHTSKYGTNWSISAWRLENGTALVSGTSYIDNQSGDGYLYFKRSNSTQNPSNTTVVDYTYHTDNYVYDSTSRTITGLLVLFFVIGLILIIFFYVRPDILGLGA